MKNLKSATFNQTRTLGDSNYAYNFNTFLVTGQSKESTFDENPYAAYYAKFARDIFLADEIVLIGYSFGDPHFNRLFLNFLTANESSKVVIVTNYTDSINVVRDGTKQDSFIRSVLHFLSKRAIPLKSPHGEYLFSENVDIINQIGYGELAPNVLLYKKGYNSFLEEFFTILGI
jgi:hypothetical protein